MVSVDIPKFGVYKTSRNYLSYEPSDLADALNTVWGDGSMYGRDGSTLVKSNAQWGSQRILGESDFSKTGEAVYYTVVALADGRLFYDVSSSATFGISSATWTEITSITNTSPALSVSTTIRKFYGFNNKLFIADGTNNLYWWDATSNQLTDVTLPAALTGNVVGLREKSSSLVVLDDAGKTHLSQVNDGTDLTAAGTGFLNYGRTEGLTATNIINFGDDLLITTEDKELKKYQTYRLSGIQFYDPLVVGSDTNKFEVTRLRSFSGIIGATGQEIGSDTIGLTPRGFIGVQQAVNSDKLENNDYISFPIRDLIEQIDFNRSDLMSSCIDFVKGRYYCAVPLEPASEGCDIILVYDFQQSRPQEGLQRWSVWSFPFDANIGRVFSWGGQPFMSTTEGKVYKLDDPNANYSDDGSAYTILIKLPLIGGEQKGSQKIFNRLNLNIINISNLRTGVKGQLPFDIKFQPYSLSGGTEFEKIDLNTFAPISIQQSNIGIEYDTNATYDTDYYDGGGNDSRLYTTALAGGSNSALGWILSTEEAGVNWGLGGLSLEVEAGNFADNKSTNI